MGCNSCGAGVFDPAPVSPTAVEMHQPVAEKPITEPTLRNGLMRYPDGQPQPDSIDGFERTAGDRFESVMPPCKQRYEVMSVDRTGLTTVKHTCLHAESGHTNQYVCLAICQACPLRRRG